MASRFQDIYNEAGDLYKKNRSYDAAVAFEQARQVAKEYGLAQEAAEAGVWAAISWHEVSRPVKTLSLLMEILSADTDLDVMDRWRARKRFFLISLLYSPELEKLQRQCEKLQQFQQEYPQLPISDVHQDIGYLLAFQGKWQDALSEYELAWSKRTDDGYTNKEKAHRAGFYNLLLDKIEATQRWCQLLGQTETEWPSSRCVWHVLNSEIALYQEDWQKAEEYATQAENKADFIQDAESSYDACFLRVRTVLLQANLGDPTQTNNLARYRLRQPYVGKPDLHTKYARALLVADYRLACVRYILRIPPVDDRWYRQPQQPPTHIPPNFKKSDFQKRVQLTERSIRYAMRQAKHLDTCFQCTWRQEEAQKRFERLNELVSCVNQLH